MAVLLLGGVVSQASELEGALKSGAAKLQSALQDAGVSADQAKQANDSASANVSGAFHALLGGVAVGVKVLGSLAIFLSFTALSLFFLLKDGPQIRGWAERHMGVPRAVGRTITQNTLQALRGYFTGVTAVAAFNAIVIGLGALVLNVDHAGSIALVNFVAAYVPYLGAWSAGAFTVLLTLGSQGTTTALIMAVIVLLANGILQQMIQPIAFGAALGIHPLAVLIVTIAGGSLFGMIGLVLAAPLTSAATHIAADLARAQGGGSAVALGLRGRGVDHAVEVDHEQDRDESHRDDQRDDDPDVVGVHQGEDAEHADRGGEQGHDDEARLGDFALARRRR